MSTIAQWDSGALPATYGTAPTVSGDAFTTAANTVSAGEWTTTATNQWSARYYITTPAAWPSASFSMFLAQAAFGGASPILARANMAGSGQPGQLRLVRSGGTQLAASPNNTIALSTQYRIEIQANGTTSMMRMAVFPMGSDTALWSADLAGATGTSVAAFTVGNGSIGSAAPPTIGPLAYRHLLIANTYGAWLGRDASDPLPSTGPEVLGVWNGTSVDAATMLGVWDGSAIIAATPLAVI